MEKEGLKQSWRLSPSRGEFLVMGNSEIDIKGAMVNISLYIGGQKCEFSGLAICSPSDSKHVKYLV